MKPRTVYVRALQALAAFTLYFECELTHPGHTRLAGDIRNFWVMFRVGEAAKRLCAVGVAMGVADEVMRDVCDTSTQLTSCRYSYCPCLWYY
jgi:hypothetical protein